MRFIGSKAALLQNIETVIGQNTNGTEKIFCDLFSGTGVVSRYFKPKYEIYSNDLLYFSYVIQKATIENNKQPLFERLASIGIIDPVKFLEDAPLYMYDFDDEKNFIAKNYSPNGPCNRMYVSSKNAVRIDFIRNTIESWKKSQLLSESEYYYLLASLIEGVPFVSNITGTYGAYLKQWDKRAFKEFEMIRPQVFNNYRYNKSYNKDANTLISELEGDILYLDPPYNSRQYAPNYHLLETISKYDYPEIRGVTGMRPYQEEKSSFCIKNEVLDAFEHLVAKAHFSNIILSYSSEGLMTSEQIESILTKYGTIESYKRYDIPYKRYQSKKIKKGCIVNEYLFYIKKNIQQKEYYSIQNSEIVLHDNPVEYTRKYLKSPLNYIGGKYKLLPQIMPLFPANIATFVDLFSGGANVAINVTADNIVCNDINTKIIELFKTFQNMSLYDILSQIEKNIKEYALSKENEEGFLAFRDYYNKTKHPVDLYTLTCFSFNYQFRFNNNHEYNNPFGRNRSHFSTNMRANLAAFIFKLKRSRIVFKSADFSFLDLSLFGPQDMLYCDPPYLITTGTYNDGNRGFKDWGETEEQQLYELLDTAHKKNIRFALSNVIEHKGIINTFLQTWSKKYTVIYLSADYSNSSYNTKRGDSKEVLVINY